MKRYIHNITQNETITVLGMELQAQAYFEVPPWQVSELMYETILMGHINNEKLAVSFNTTTIMDKTNSLKALDHLYDSYKIRKKYLVEDYNQQGRITAATWYFKEEDGVYSEKVEETTYTYNQNGTNLLGYVVKTYDPAGDLLFTDEFDAYSDSNKKIFKRKI